MEFGIVARRVSLDPPGASRLAHQKEKGTSRRFGVEGYRPPGWAGGGRGSRSTRRRLLVSSWALVFALLIVSRLEAERSAAGISAARAAGRSPSRPLQSYAFRHPASTDHWRPNPPGEVPGPSTQSAPGSRQTGRPDGEQEFSPGGEPDGAPGIAGAIAGRRGCRGGGC